MTYEEKMLSVFSRYRGEALSPPLLKKMESDCENEIWAHLPPEVLATWELHLALNDQGQLELRPKQLKPGGAEELENALRSEFISRRPPTGGIAGVSLNFSGDVDSTSKPGQVSHFQVGSPTSAFETHTAAAAPSEASAATILSGGAETLSAGEVEAQANDLGIPLPKNSSLLGPFLKALSIAHEYKRRALAAEARLAQLNQNE